MNTSTMRPAWTKKQEFNPPDARVRWRGNAAVMPDLSTRRRPSDQRYWGHSATGVAENHAPDARNGSSAGALVALRRSRELGDRSGILDLLRLPYDKGSHRFHHL